jgi:16S rRNA processing protein RimM
MIVLGRIVAPFGVRGWLKVRPFGDAPETWRKMPQWWLCADAEAAEAAWQPYELEDFRSHGAHWVAKLAGVDDRDGAERLDGRFVAAPRMALPGTETGEYYWNDLIGLAVANEQGDPLGSVTALLETGAHPVLVVKGEEGGERLLPFVAEVVKDVDVPGGRIRVAWGMDW